MDSADNARLVEVSLIRLMARPEVYDGKRIFTGGVFSNDGEEPRLYLDDESFVRHYYLHSLPIETEGRLPSLDKIDGKFIRIIAVFKASGSESDPAGILTAVSVVQRHGIVVWSNSETRVKD